MLSVSAERLCTDHAISTAANAVTPNPQQFLRRTLELATKSLQPKHSLRRPLEPYAEPLARWSAFRGVTAAQHPWNAVATEPVFDTRFSRLDTNVLSGTCRSIR